MTNISTNDLLPLMYVSVAKASLFRSIYYIAGLLYVQNNSATAINFPVQVHVTTYNKKEYNIIHVYYTFLKSTL